MIQVIPSGAALGAEIRGVDLSQPLSEEAFREVEAALHRHEVVFFRKQKISDSDQKRFSLRFGPDLDIHPFTQFAKPGNPEVFVLSNIKDESGKPLGAADAAQYWHTDLSYMPAPSRVSVLYGIEIPHDDAGRPLGDTEFASTTKAYDGLPQELKRRLEGLKATHYAQKPKNTTATHFKKDLDAETQAKLNQVVHPVFRTHPYTGKKCLYVNHGFTDRILGLDQAESDRILQELFDHLVKPEYLYAHKWQPNDVVMWDNCSTIHQGVGNYKLPQRRLMYRTIVKGTVPF